MKKQFWLMLVALALVAAACGGDADTTTTAGGTETTAGGTETTAAAGDNPTINIVANPWTASMLNAEVAKQLIESELGYPVEIVAIDENTMFTGIPSAASKATGLVRRRKTPTGRFNPEIRAWGMATPRPKPVEPSFSRSSMRSSTKAESRP